MIDLPKCRKCGSERFNFVYADGMEQMLCASCGTEYPMISFVEEDEQC